MNFLNKRCDSYFGITVLYADLESRSSTQMGPAVLWGWILQEGPRGKRRCNMVQANMAGLGP